MICSIIWLWYIIKSEFKLQSVFRMKWQCNQSDIFLLINVSCIYISPVLLYCYCIVFISLCSTVLRWIKVVQKRCRGRFFYPFVHVSCVILQWGSNPICIFRVSIFGRIKLNWIHAKERLRVAACDHGAPSFTSLQRAGGSNVCCIQLEHSEQITAQLDKTLVSLSSAR